MMDVIRCHVSHDHVVIALVVPCSDSFGDFPRDVATTAAQTGSKAVVDGNAARIHDVSSINNHRASTVVFVKQC